MIRMTAQTLHALEAAIATSLAKEAASAASALKLIRKAVTAPRAQGGAAGLVSGAGMGGMVGGAAGLAEGGVKGYREAREQGASTGDAIRAGLGGAGRQATRRAAQGALLGGAIGGAAGAASPNLHEALARAPVVGAGARFGQRQLHGMTGWTPKGGIRSIRGGAYDAEQALGEASRKLQGAKGKGVASAEKGLDKAYKHFGASSKAEQMGLTSLPGYAKALKKNKLEALKAGANEQWTGSGVGGKALIYGGTGAAAAGEVAKGTDAEGHGGLERAGKLLGGALPMMAGPLPLAATLAAAPALAAAGGFAGKLGDKLRKKKPPPEKPMVAPPSLDPAGGASSPTEHVYSNAALGLPPDGM